MIKTKILGTLLILAILSPSAFGQLEDVRTSTLRDYFDWDNRSGVQIAAHRWAISERDALSGFWNGEVGPPPRTFRGVYVLPRSVAAWGEIRTRDDDPHSYAVKKGYLTGFFNREYRRPYHGITMVKRGKADLIWIPWDEIDDRYPFGTAANRTAKSRGYDSGIWVQWDRDNERTRLVAFPPKRTTHEVNTPDVERHSDSNPLIEQ